MRPAPNAGLQAGGVKCRAWGPRASGERVATHGVTHGTARRVGSGGWVQWDSVVQNKPKTSQQLSWDSRGMGVVWVGLPPTEGQESCGLGCRQQNEWGRVQSRTNQPAVEMGQQGGAGLGRRQQGEGQQCSSRAHPSQQPTAWAGEASADHTAAANHSPLMTDPPPHGPHHPRPAAAWAAWGTGRPGPPRTAGGWPWSGAGRGRSPSSCR